MSCRPTTLQVIAAGLSMQWASSRRRKILCGLGALLVVLAIPIGRPAFHLISVAWRDVDELQPLPAGYVDDASRMNATHVAEVWPVPADMAAAEVQLATLLQRARQDGLRVAIAGARHTMGGHTIYPDGVVLDMLPLMGMLLDEDRNLLRVEAGAAWADVIAYLDKRGRSVAVMQSNNSFSVGGSISCNCHGWQYGKPPIASTVESFRLMLADGSIVRCSREENAELFSLALGGYGLFGVILDVELRVVPNVRYRLEQFIVPTLDGLATFDERIGARQDVAMAYGRLGVAPSNFLNEAIVNALYDDPAADGGVPALESAGNEKLRRRMFRGSAGSDYGKELRWSAEAKLQPQLQGTYFSRNQLLNESTLVFQNRSAATTDVLHEYFVPRDGLARFVAAMQRIVPTHNADLMNVTVRYVEEDEDSFLRYADREMFALVLLFVQPATAAGNAAMEALTQELIDAALDAGGRYYLPYRLHATREQFARAYPQGAEFFRLKRQYDPGETFQNEFYVKYGRER